MSTTTAEVKTEQVESTTTEQRRDADEPLGEAGLKALQSERDARAAAEARVKAVEAELEKLHRANETEAQRIQRERDEAMSAVSAKDAKIASYEACDEAGLSLKWAPRLVGSTPEELLADAKAMAAELSAKDRPGTPKPDQSQGATGSNPVGGSVSAGRDLFRDMHAKKNTPTS